MADNLQKQEADQKARKALLWFASSSVIWQACSWIFTIYLARILLPEDYGVMALAGSFHPYLLILVTLRLELWLVQREEVNQRVERTAFTLIFILSSLVSLFCLTAAGEVAGFLEDERVKDVFLVMALSFIFKGASAVPEAKLKRDLNFKPIALMNLSIGFLRQVVTVILALKGYGYWALMIGQLIGDFLSAVWLNVASPVKYGFLFEKSLIKEALKFGAYTAGGLIFWAGGTKIDDLLVGKMLGANFLGFYTMAYMLAELPLSKMNAFVSSILLSYYSKLKQDSEVLLKAYLDVSRGMSLIIVPGLIGMAIVSPEMIPILIGEKWRPIVPMFQVMCGIWSLISCVDQVSRLLLAMGRANLLFYISAINFTILGLSFYFGLSWFGEKGLYYTWLTAYPLTVLVSGKFVNIATGIGAWRYIKNYSITFISVAVMAAVTWSYREFMLGRISDLLLLISTILVGGATYILTLRVLFYEEALRVYRMVRHGPQVKEEEAIATA